jgi:hypothetical protein
VLATKRIAAQKATGRALSSSARPLLFWQFAFLKSQIESGASYPTPVRNLSL